jgi:hypothetical protein
MPAHLVLGSGNLSHLCFDLLVPSVLRYKICMQGLEFSAMAFQNLCRLVINIYLPVLVILVRLIVTIEIVRGLSPTLCQQTIKKGAVSNE